MERLLAERMTTVHRCRHFLSPTHALGLRLAADDGADADRSLFSTTVHATSSYAAAAAPPASSFTVLSPAGWEEYMSLLLFLSRMRLLREVLGLLLLFLLFGKR